MNEMSFIRAVSGIAVRYAAVWGGETGETKYELTEPFDFSTIPELFSAPISNYSRFPDSAKAVCATCALLMKAADISYADEQPRNTALLTTGFSPTIQLNEAFFYDYAANDRVLARGNLFIYTLPTSSIAEASIYFGFTGPCYYFEADRDVFGQLLRSAEQLVRTGQARDAVCLWQEQQTCVALLVSPDSGEKKKQPLRKLLANSTGWHSPCEALQHFFELDAHDDTVENSFFESFEKKHIRR